MKQYYKTRLEGDDAICNRICTDAMLCVSSPANTIKTYRHTDATKKHNNQTQPDAKHCVSTENTFKQIL